MAITLVTPKGTKYREYTKHTNKPILIYYHGAGQRGTDPTVIDNTAFVKIFVAKYGNDYTIVAPQTNYWGWIGDPKKGHDGEDFANYILANYQSDGRLYITGHSMGSPWGIVVRLGAKVTAFVVVAGSSTEYQAVISFAKLHIPARHYHGDADTSENSYTKGKQVCSWYAPENGNVLITYVGKGHGIDGLVYNEPDLSTWMLSKGNPIIVEPPVENPTSVKIEKINATTATIIWSDSTTSNITLS